jgi:acyl-coenzyme A thioesterase PaaI-like protein
LPAKSLPIKSTDLAFNRLLGIRPAPGGAAHVLEMPFGANVKNHLGSMHAAAQFALAEAASAECLQRHCGAEAGEVFAVVRSVEVKYRKPAAADLLAYAEPDDATRHTVLTELATRGRVSAVILIDLKDREGTLTFHGKFEWFISRLPFS